MHRAVWRLLLIWFACRAAYSCVALGTNRNRDGWLNMWFMRRGQRIFIIRQDWTDRLWPFCLLFWVVVSAMRHSRCRCSAKIANHVAAINSACTRPLSNKCLRDTRNHQTKDRKGQSQHGGHVERQNAAIASNIHRMTEHIRNIPDVTDTQIWVAIHRTFDNCHTAGQKKQFSYAFSVIFINIYSGQFSMKLSIKFDCSSVSCLAVLWCCGECGLQHGRRGWKSVHCKRLSTALPNIYQYPHSQSQIIIIISSSIGSRARRIQNTRAFARLKQKERQQQQKIKSRIVIYANIAIGHINIAEYYAYMIALFTNENFCLVVMVWRTPLKSNETTKKRTKKENCARFIRFDRSDMEYIYVWQTQALNRSQHNRIKHFSRNILNVWCARSRNSYHAAAAFHINITIFIEC